MKKAANTAPVLDASAISHKGLMLMGYQRTKQISRRAKVAWEAGDPEPLSAEITARGAEVFAGTVDEIYREYVPMRDFLRARSLVPERVIDVGCGQAINDAFLLRDFGCAVTLVDIEETPDQYHQWAGSGSGYATLADAGAFLLANGLTKDRLETINPVKTPKALAALKGDLVTSLFSCGFHYPLTDYVDLICATIAAGGAVVLDLRARYFRKPDAALSQVMAAASPQVIFEMEKSVRVFFGPGHA